MIQRIKILFFNTFYGGANIMKCRNLVEKELLIMNYRNEVYMKLDDVRNKIIALNRELSVEKFDNNLLDTYKRKNDEFTNLNNVLRNLNETLEFLQQRKAIYLKTSAFIEKN